MHVADCAQPRRILQPMTLSGIFLFHALLALLAGLGQADRDRLLLAGHLVHDFDGRSRENSYFFFARNLPKTAPATRLPAAFDPYFLPALASIFEKFFPRFPRSFPARADLAE